MSELPLSKFAPFTKEECKFQYEVSNKLDEIGVKCSNCIYFGESVIIDDNPSSPDEDNKQQYICNILSDTWRDNLVCEDSLCRFFTNQEDIEESQEDKSSNKKSDEELSLALQKLDFTNSNEAKESIKILREKLINENQ